MQITNYSNYLYLIPGRQSQAANSSTSSANFPAQASANSDQNQSNGSNSSSPAITGSTSWASATGYTEAQLDQMMSHGVVSIGAFLTTSDLNLIKQTTGQTFVPSVGSGGKTYDASGNEVSTSSDTNDLISALSAIRQSGVSDGSNWKAENGDITTADLQDLMKQYQSATTGPNGGPVFNDTVINQAISVLNTNVANNG